VLTVQSTRGTRLDLRLGPVTASTSTLDPEPGVGFMPLVWVCDVFGTPGGDILRGTAAPNSICGLGGNDRIVGNGGSDILVAGSGRDAVFGGGGRDAIVGEAGGDVGFGQAGRDFLSMGDGDDLAFGGAGDDGISGGTGEDRLYGGAGNDVLDSLDGFADLVHGGPGRDTAYPDSLDRMVSIERNGFDSRRAPLARFLPGNLRYESLERATKGRP
jgi:RTX calcium-binding nonapeptide repeat (4 copies)